MRCPLEFENSAELIVGYSAGTLDPRTTAAFERHMERCGECRQAAALQNHVWAALDQWPATRVSPDFDRRVLQRIGALEQPGRRMWRALVPVGACAAMATLFLLNQSDQTPLPPRVQIAPQIEQVEHALDDMDMLSQLGVAVAPSASSRRI